MMTTAIQATSNVGEKDLLACVPHLRAFAWFLTKNHDRADELVQDTNVRALTAAHQFHAGTNLKAWMFAILRNLHYNEARKNRVHIQSLDDPLTYEPTVLPSQMARLEFGDFRRAFWQLADDQREALILVGVSGLSHDEAAQVCECPKGTIKSRVSRARRELLQILEDGLLADRWRDMPVLAGYIGRDRGQGPPKQDPRDAAKNRRPSRQAELRHGLVSDGTRSRLTVSANA